MHNSRQTITMTPWEIAEVEVNIRDRARLRYQRMRGKIRHPETYAAVVEFNRAHGLTPAPADKKRNFLRKRKSAFHTKRPITLAKTTHD